MTHYPHHYLVSDWLDEESVDCFPKEALLSLPGVACSQENLQSGIHLFVFWILTLTGTAAKRALEHSSFGVSEQWICSLLLMLLTLVFMMFCGKRSDNVLMAAPFSQSIKIILFFWLCCCIRIVLWSYPICIPLPILFVSIMFSLVVLLFNVLCLTRKWSNWNFTPEQCLANAAFENLLESPGQCILLLEHLHIRPASELLPYCHTIVANLRHLLKPGVPRRSQELVQQIWIKMSSLQPMR